MKKFIFAMFVAVATAVGFTSCAEDEAIGLSDLLGKTFACTEDNNGQPFVYSISFNDDTTHSFFTSDGEVGTYSVLNNTVTLNFTSLDGEVVESTSTLEGDGSSKLICSELNCVLKKQ